jgi:hypothetical protein
MHYFIAAVGLVFGQAAIAGDTGNADNGYGYHHQGNG